MTEEKEKILSDMTRAEKAERLQWIVRALGDAFRGRTTFPLSNNNSAAYG